MCPRKRAIRLSAPMHAVEPLRAFLAERKSDRSARLNAPSTETAGDRAPSLPLLRDGDGLRRKLSRRARGWAGNGFGAGAQARHTKSSCADNDYRGRINIICFQIQAILAAHSDVVSMILNNACDILKFGVFADISIIFGGNIRAFLKIEAFNAAGSIKLKPAINLVNTLEKLGALNRKRVLIDTTSGNMGIALSIVAKCKGYDFICVTDEKMTAHNRKIVSAYGAEIVVMPHSTLDERYRYIQSRIVNDNSLVWTQQFTSPVNPAAHQETTATEILEEFETVDHLFIGVGTGGALAGCSKTFTEKSPHTKLFAVDVEGSLHFGNANSSYRRRIPGIGATRRSPFLKDIRIDGAIIVSERDTVRACAEVRDASGWLVGGSTGSVIAAAQSLQHEFPTGSTLVCVGADMGERYLDTIYNSEWVNVEFNDLLSV